MCNEGLLSLISQADRDGPIRGIFFEQENPILITHLPFANDTFLFCMINRNDFQKVLNILETYDRILSQQVNGIEEKFPSFSINLLLRI